MTDPGAGAQIFEQGYRRYEGPRLGPGASIRSLAIHSALRALGLRRTVWAKLLPIATVLIAYVPAAIFVGVAALIPDTITRNVDVIPKYADYFGSISAAILLFVAIVGPEVLCSDRKNGMLGMYLASPLTRETYLLAKVLAVLPVLGLVTIGPQLLLLIGRTLVDAGPDGPGAFALLLARAVVGGIVVSALYTAISLAAASLTDRRAVASAGVILLLLVSSGVTSALVENAKTSHRLYLLNLFLLPFELVQRVYGERGNEPTITTAALAFAFVAWVAGAAAVVVWRYRKLTVAR
ncbi:MAG: type transport system permease protein [Actinomycetota bacterium]|nr:type transport system permease protein [Actinomycetota bacterium]